MSHPISAPNALRPSRFRPSRRAFLGAAAAAGLLALPGCATMGGRYSIEDAIRRMMELSADRAFANLLRPGGFWDNQLVRLDLPAQFGRRGGVAQAILGSPAMRARLQRSFNDMAHDAARNAAPAVADAVRHIGIRNAVALVHGDPTGATAYLRQDMGGHLIEVMVPAFGQALRIADDPLIGEALALLTGVDIGGVADSLAREADDAIWGEIGRQEAAIRADPRSSNNSLIERVFGGGGR
ncbi:DUF4197 domain-containing protein [Novosphingobium lentum]|uniref:DUF4197 domain-containing protein n=1 Tax=Novosphingobium lentum TaxID=145287 RepID=UPI00083598E8|nr:DUF4197 domain-containing protein [Novosphingobium lentum]